MALNKKWSIVSSVGYTLIHMWLYQRAADGHLGSL